jgi:hypothetical protein
MYREKQQQQEQQQQQQQGNPSYLDRGKHKLPPHRSRAFAFDDFVGCLNDCGLRYFAKSTKNGGGVQGPKGINYLGMFLYT